MSRHPDVPDPREARRTEWPWGDAVCVGDDGSTVWPDGTVTQVETQDLGTIAPMGARERWVQVHGNSLVILTDDVAADAPNGIWFKPLSILRHELLEAVALERALIDRGTVYPMRLVSAVLVDGRKRARRGWLWRARAGSDERIEWIDAEYRSWEEHVAAGWPKTPAPMVPIPMEQAA